MRSFLVRPLLFFQTKLPAVMFSPYVTKARLLQDLKHDDDQCKTYVRDGRFLVYHKGMPLLKITQGLGAEPLSKAEAVKCDFSYLSQFINDHDLLLANSVLLDVTPDDKALSAVIIPSQPLTIPDGIEQKTGGSFCDMRTAIFLLPQKDSELVSQGSSLLYWNRNTKFCSRCGHQTQRNFAGSQAKCLSCSYIFYPHVSPVSITVVTNPANDKCLLVRQPKHIKGMYTAIAGYIEPGETLEDSVRREIAEEVGLDVIQQEYLFSQHWPLPTSSLMLGCIATANCDEQVVIDKYELEDAKWFPKSKIQEVMERVQQNPLVFTNSDPSQIWIPPKGAVAHDLIHYWLNKS